MTRDYRVVAEGLRIERASANASNALERAGIRSILLKGPLQQWWLERGGPPRVSIDVDVLVAYERIDDAGAALQTIGYSRAVTLPEEVGREHGSVWVARGQVPIELHWSLVGVDADKAWDVFSRETECAALLGTPVEIPNEAARCTIVALHAAQHGVAQRAIFGDLEKALVVADTATWRRAADLARSAGGWTPFAGALSLSPQGRNLLAELGESLPTLSERQALSLLTPAPTSRGFYFLARRSGLRAKVAFVLLKLAPSPDFMRLRYPLARRGRIGLTLAYAYRPLWLARWALPGLRTWRRAQRLAKSGLGADPHDGNRP
jgi:Uncharacterised nucleotidyltransferase